MVNKMDLVTNFRSAVNTVSAPRSSAPVSSFPGGAFGSSNNVQVEKPGFWGKLFGSDAVVNHDSGQAAPSVPRVITVRDGNASAGQQIIGSDAEYYRAYQGGNQTFLQKIGTSVMSILRDS
jgi:hypothetical protein